MKAALIVLLAAWFWMEPLAAAVVEKCAVSNADYCEFLNAVAREGDAVALWNPLMQEHWWGGIERKEGQKYSYRVKNGYEKLPVTCVTWESAARYCNWLSYGRPTVGREEVGTTEGTDTCGVYDTQGYGTDQFVRSTKPVVRQSSAAYFLPSVDEWRAVAFAGGDTGIVNVYAEHWALPFPHLLPVDIGSTNRLGFINMFGNVGEWVETRRGNFFLALGGSLIRGKYSIRKDFSEGDESNRAISSFGFRVAHAESPAVLKVPNSLSSVSNSLVPSSSLSNSSNSNIQTFTHSNIDPKWCRIADEGNLRDPIYKVGRVNYTFEMAKYPVTNREWCDFMNAVGVARSKELGLYNLDMSTGVCGGIEISPSNEGGNQKFSPKQGYGNRPVVYISYRDAMRYCNWLQTGDTEKGAYDVSRPNSRRNPGAKFFIPTDDEWCKAAYYDPTRLGTRKYWDYPCCTSDLPSNAPKAPHACNYLRDGVHLGAKGPYFLAEVAAYPTSDTYYGCRQMAGNVWEWVEPISVGKLNLRGGSFSYTEFGMGIWNRDEAGFKDELNVFGLRIACAVENPKVIHSSILECWGEWLQDSSLKRLLFMRGVFSAILLGLGIIVGWTLRKCLRH